MTERLHPAMESFAESVRSCGRVQGARRLAMVDAGLTAQRELMAEGVRRAASVFDGRFGARQVTMILFDIAARLASGEEPSDGR